MSYRIITEDPFFELVGMSIFDKDGLEEFADTHHKNTSFTQYITNDPSGYLVPPEDLYSGILNDYSGGPGINIGRFNKAQRAFVPKDVKDYAPIGNNKIQDSIDAHELYLKEKHRHEDETQDFFAGVSYNYDQAKEFVEDVLDSSSGCIVWHPKMFFVIKEDCIREFSPRLELHFIDPIESPPDKQIASYTPFIADIPRSKGGHSYGARETEIRYDVDGIGSFRPPIEGGNSNPDNLRAGELDLSYNESTGKFEAGTKQILVRLITDIDGVNAPGFDPETIHEITADQTYTLDGEFNQLGDWDEESHIGSGVPVHVQRGNPYFFGPNYTDRGFKRQTKEVLRITNRTPRSFTTNQLVLCNYLDGEWVPTDLGQDGERAASVSIGNWSFQKLIASSDNFFRDARYLDSSSPDYAKLQINPGAYESIMRAKFYNHLGAYDSSVGIPVGNRPISHLTAVDPGIFNKISFMNLGNESGTVALNQEPKNWDFQASKDYIQVTSFDQMGNFAGGKNDANVIARTNFYSRIDETIEDTDPLPPLEMVEFWGASFPEGYSSEKVSDMLGSRTNVHMKSSPEIGDIYRMFFKTGDTEFIASSTEEAFLDTDPGRNVSINYKDKGMFFNHLRDRIASQLPAEVATNGPPGSEDYNPIQHWHILQKFDDVGVNMLDSVSGVFEVDPKTGEQYRYNWLYQYDSSDALSGIYNPVYGLKPASPHRIAFYPLAAEVVSSTDYHRGGTPPTDSFSVLEFGMPSLMSKQSQTRSAVWHKDHGGAVDHLLGSDDFFYRNDVSLLPFIQHTYNANGGPPGDPSKLNHIVPYFGYVEQNSKGGNDISLPTIWPDYNDANASCVGIIAAKTKITFRGSELRFLLDQQFGLALDTRVTTSNTNNFGFLNLGGGQGLSLGGVSSNTFSNSYPRWGSVNDNPNSFHTTALHVKMFDAWPEDQTFYDARYFSVFHFNPGILLSPAEQDEELLEVQSRTGNTFSFYPDKLTESVDFKVPTYIDNSIAQIDDVITASSEILDEAYWRVNTIRRGMMLTNGGFNYFKSEIGINAIEIINGGVGYVQDEILEIGGGTGKGASIKVSVDSAGSITSAVVEEAGEGYKPVDFGDFADPDPSNSKLQAIGGTGSDADIRIISGKVIEINGLDEGPKSRTNDGYLKLTDNNNNGQGNKDDGFVTGSAERFLPIEGATTIREYDLFTYFHNDITHTVHFGGGNMRIEPQRVLLEITAL